MMDNCLPFEVEREKEFAPVKNALGTDSVESARELLKKNGIAIQQGFTKFTELCHNLNTVDR